MKNRIVLGMIAGLLLILGACSSHAKADEEVSHESTVCTTTPSAATSSSSAADCCGE
ncbi:MAG: hypothetical protein LKJ03_06090 [Enterococcaceae bacterium]|jgi:PBP1b-binding outer membrane lipoprotein LpoB|nr:hypothetical protein [Enterococcaceae bacterium]MCI1919361.1 hypothetical protein [Enterococcaceae bacterium]